LANGRGEQNQDAAVTTVAAVVCVAVLALVSAAVYVCRRRVNASLIDAMVVADAGMDNPAYDTDGTDGGADHALYDNIDDMPVYEYIAQPWNTSPVGQPVYAEADPCQPALYDTASLNADFYSSSSSSSSSSSRPRSRTTPSTLCNATSV
jgi:hypothetical protein